MLRYGDKDEDFDAVKMMREARDRISREIRGMSFEEQAAYFKRRAAQTRTKLEPREERCNPRPVV